jgi:hypothetical protein
MQTPSISYSLHKAKEGHGVAQLIVALATGQKVMGSILMEVIGIFSYTMTLRLTQPLK